MRYPTPERRRLGEIRFNHQFKAIWWEVELSASEPELWYWKLLKNGEPVNGGLSETPGKCRSEANWAFQGFLEGTFCAVEEFDADLGCTVTRLVTP